MPIAPRSLAGLGFNGEYLERHAVQMLGSYRAYNPALMRFHNPDSLSPFGKGGLNAYGYCLGDPLNHLDPTGHMVLWSWRSRPVQFAVGTLAAGVAVGLAATIVPQGKAQDVLIKTAVGLLASAAVLAVMPALKAIMPERYRSIGRLLGGGRRQGGRRESTTGSLNAETAANILGQDNPPTDWRDKPPSYWETTGRVPVHTEEIPMVELNPRPPRDNPNVTRQASLGALDRFVLTAHETEIREGRFQRRGRL